MRIMKKILFLSILFSTLLASCELEKTQNGDLDGFWQLHRIDTLATGGSKDTRAERIFWSFDHKLMMTYGYGEFVYQFYNTGTELVVYEPHVSNREDGDPAVASVDMLRHVGINSLEEHFSIVKLKSDKMVLESDLLRLNFRKY